MRGQERYQDVGGWEGTKLSVKVIFIDFRNVQNTFGDKDIGLFIAVYFFVR